MEKPNNPTTAFRKWLAGQWNLWAWLTEPEERRVFKGGFRLPWSRYASVKLARDMGWTL